MKIFRRRKKKLSFISYESLTINQAKRIIEISHRNLTTLEKSIAMASIIYGKDESYYYGLPMEAMVEQLKELNRQIMPNVFRHSAPNQFYTVKGVRYKMTLNLSEMTVAQHIDYMATIDKDPSNIARLCSILLIPDGKGYNEGYSITENAKIFGDSFLWVDAENISFFLRTLRESSIKSLVTYLKWSSMMKLIWHQLIPTRRSRKMREEARKMLRIIRTNGLSLSSRLPITPTKG